MSSQARLSSRVNTPTRSPRVNTSIRTPRRHVSPLFRGIADEMDCDHSIDPIVGGISASEWRSSREWKNRVAQEIELEIDEAIATKDEEHVLQLQREIAFFQHLDKELFFHGLDRLDFPITIKDIREEIQARLITHLKEIRVQTSSSPTWLPTSPLSTQLVSSPPAPKIIRPLDRQERLRLATKKILEEGKSMVETANVFGVHRASLHARVHKGRQSATDYGKSCRKLNEIEELAILQFIDRWCQLGFPPRYKMVREKAQKLLALRVCNPEPLGVNWATRFLNRHPDYKSKFPRHLDQERYMNTNPEVFEQWFNLYQETLVRYGIASGDVYNMDAKGILMGVAGNIRKVIVRKSDKHVFSVHSGDRKWSTVIECVSIRGVALKPFIIFEGKQIQKAWQKEFPKATYAISENGWTDNQHGLIWVRDCFHPQTAHLGGRRLLIIDGHASHVSVDFIECCWALNIVPLCLPPHTTHFLQPLDVGCFGPLDKAYKKELEARNAVGEVYINKLDYLGFPKKARSNIMTQNIIMSGWFATGLYPFDPQKVINKLSRETKPTTPPPAIISSIITSFNTEANEKTPTTKDEFVDLLDQFVPYLPSSFQANIRRLKKAASIAFVDRHLLQDSTTSLFKANLAKEERRKKRQEHGERATFGVGFGRVLTQSMADKKREEDEQKAQIAEAKKQASEARKVNTVLKKQEAIDAKAKRVEAQELRKKKAHDLKAKMDDIRQQKNQERLIKKLQKEEEQKHKSMQAGNGEKKRGRPRKEASTCADTQQSLPTFVPEHAYPDPETLLSHTSLGPYYMEGVMERVEEME